MKLTDLLEKGPIIGAPKGSQKDARLSPGTDDPSKYMRGGEWEAYREPQGVNSPAGKIAGGRKKGTTRTKNKKMSESENALYEILNHGIAFWYNPYTDQVVSELDWTQQSSHSQAAIDDLGIPELEGVEKQGTDDYNVIGIAMDHGWIRGLTYEGKLVLQGESQTHAEDAYKALAPFLKQVQGDEGHVRQVELASLDGYERSIVVEGLQPSGAGDSNDVRPRDSEALTLSAVSDTTRHNRAKGAKMPGSEAPTKVVKANVKKSLDDRPGNTSDINEAVNQIVNEAIPRVMPRDYNAEYELMDDKNEETIGVAKISHGVIELLSVRNDLAEDFEGHIMSRLLSTIVRDADLANANLAIAMDNPDNLGQKRFLERFGFRATGKNVMKRNAGSVTPPSVLTARL